MLPVNSSMGNSLLRCPICSIQCHSPHCSVLLSALMASHFLFVFSNAPKVERAGVISFKRAWYICQTFMHYCPSTFMHYCPSEDNWIASIFLLIAFFFFFLVPGPNQDTMLLLVVLFLVSHMKEREFNFT